MAKPPIDPPDSYWMSDEPDQEFCEICHQIIEPKSRIADYGDGALAHLECAPLNSKFKVRTYE